MSTIGNVVGDVKEDILGTFERYMQKLSSFEKKQVRDRIRRINSKYESISNLKRTKTAKKEIDPMFFCFEDLPAYGKEYWFMKFVSTENDDDRQLLTMFGISTNDLRINSKRVNCSSGSEHKNGFMTSWFFDGGKHMVVDAPGKVSIGDNQIDVMGKDKTIVSYAGEYPKYGLSVTKGNRRICDLKLGAPCDDSVPFEFSHFFKGFLGFALINLYFDFEGMLNNKKFKGKCYVQKVIVIGPFVPWYWGRIVFSNGSVLSYYVPYLKLYKFDYTLGDSSFEFYDNETKNTFKTKDISVEKFGKKFPRWVITNSKRSLFVSMNTYASHKFVFKRLGFFTYEEYLGRATDIMIEGKSIDMKKLGSGFGLIEDAKGFVL